MNLGWSRGALFGLLLCGGMAGYGQSAPNNQPKKPSEPLPDAPSHVQNPEKTKEEEEHIFHVVPTVDITDPHYPVQPLSTRQKFQLATKRAFDRFTFIKAGASAGFSQAVDSHEGYGQGAEGFGRRYGAAFAGSVHNEYFARFVFPSLLHQDPRYFRQGKGPAGPRVRYAMSRVVVTRGDNGARQFNFSQVLGSLFSAALANAYYPDEDRTAGRTFARAGKHLGLSAGLNVLKEFGPQLRRKMFRKKTKETPIAPAPEKNGPTLDSPAKKPD